LLHQVNDIRLLSENNLRFLEQFKSTFWFRKINLIY
jgi:hypothetical protein